MTVFLKSPTVKGFTANNLSGLVWYLRQRLERWIVHCSTAVACSTDRSVDSVACTVARAVAHKVQCMLRGVPVGLHYCFGRWFNACPVACKTACVYCFARWYSRDVPGLLALAHSQRFGGWFGLRRAWRLSQWLTRGALADGLDRDGPGPLPDSSLAVLQRIVRIEMDPASFPTTHATTASQVR